MPEEEPGRGGGGGGADWVELELPGIGGAGGTFAGSAMSGKGGAGGGAAGVLGPAAEDLLGTGDFASTLGELGELPSSMADNGRGGPMVPNNMEASCFALPPVGRSSSSSDESSVEPTADHSSSSGLARDGRLSMEGKERCAWVEAGSSCWVILWNGFVDSSLELGEVIEVGA